MKAYTVIALFVIFGATWADHHFYSHPKYHYSYGVTDKHTGDIKSAGESRDGHLTKGYYELIQPDGVHRLVKYVAGGKLGFQAQVINKGHAKHPGHYHHHGHGHGYGGIGGGRGVGGGLGGGVGGGIGGGFGGRGIGGGAGIGGGFLG